MTKIKDSQVLVRRGSTSNCLPIINYYGKKEALIRGGFVTEKMLHMDPIDNGFGITEDEFGNDVTVIENHSGPGVYLITKYLSNPGRKDDEKSFDGQSIEDVDVSGILQKLSG